jgi:hypothetical protein
MLGMGKYDPLSEYLGKRRSSGVRLTFAQIEELLEAALPISARRSTC